MHSFWNLVHNVQKWVQRTKQRLKPFCDQMYRVQLRLFSHHRCNKGDINTVSVTVVCLENKSILLAITLKCLRSVKHLLPPWTFYFRQKKEKRKRNFKSYLSVKNVVIPTNAFHLYIVNPHCHCGWSLSWFEIVLKQNINASNFWNTDGFCLASK